MTDDFVGQLLRQQSRIGRRVERHHEQASGLGCRRRESPRDDHKRDASGDGQGHRSQPQGRPDGLGRFWLDRFTRLMIRLRGVDRGLQPVPTPRERLEEPWFVRVVAKRLAHLADCRVQAGIDVHTDVIPQSSPQVLSTHDLLRMFEERDQESKRQILERDEHTVSAKLAGIDVYLERIEADWRALHPGRV